MVIAQSTGAGRGRRRSEGSHAAILAAARALLLEVGYGGVTIEHIAKRAAAGKPTIYRWWPTKAAIYIELFLQDAAKFQPAERSQGVEAELRELMGALCRLYGQTEFGVALAGIFAEAQLDPSILEPLRTHVLEARRQGFLAAIHRGLARGELRADVDPEAAADCLFGPVLYRLLLKHGTLDAAFGDEVVTLFLRSARA